MIDRTPGEQRLQAPTFKWLILAALAWSQLSFALHEFDHPILEYGDRCAVCAELDRDDDELSDRADLSCSSTQGCAESPDARDTVLATPRSAYSARASP